MAKCCAIEQTPRPQRRLHGLQLPLHYQQVIGWIVFVITAIINFAILVNIQFQELKIISLTIFTILYVTHVVSHSAALLLDPSEDDLKKLKVNNVPEFDRSIHTHVIENGRCHLCNIYTSSKKTKHCSICNKCVDRFDHHCKWLNNCVGQRNYAAFITAATTALFISMFTSCLCLTDIILFLSYPQKLSASAQQFINCSIYEAASYNKYCKSSICFLVFLIVLFISAFAIACALLHLCCFHVYICILGVSTYEYIVRSGTPDAPRINCTPTGCCRKRCIKKLYIVKKNHNSTDGVPEDPGKTLDSEDNVGNLIGIIINHELDKAKKMFLYDKNKIHPENDIAER